MKDLPIKTYKGDKDNAYLAFNDSVYPVKDGLIIVSKSILFKRYRMETKRNIKTTITH